jgi:hypothetical protein
MQGSRLTGDPAGKGAVLARETGRPKVKASRSGERRANLCTCTIPACYIWTHRNACRMKGFAGALALISHIPAMERATKELIMHTCAGDGSNVATPQERNVQVSAEVPRNNDAHRAHRANPRPQTAWHVQHA